MPKEPNPALKVRRVKRILSECQSLAEVLGIIKAAREREAELTKALTEQRDRAREVVWDAARKSKPGQVAAVFQEQEVWLQSAENGRRTTQLVKKRLDAGSILHVHAVQPRAKKVWLKADAGDAIYMMTPRELAALDVQFFPDELTLHVMLTKQGLGGASGTAVEASSAEDTASTT